MKQPWPQRCGHAAAPEQSDAGARFAGGMAFLHHSERDPGLNRATSSNVRLAQHSQTLLAELLADTGIEVGLAGAAGTLQGL